jgi:aspartate/tyrosine/aromatic aminotransferase
MSSWFRNIEPAPKDPILGVTEAFLADQSPNKVNVGVVSSSNSPSLSLFPIYFSVYFINFNSIEEEIEMK